MSTVVIVKKNGSVAIAADTLLSFGSLKLPAHGNRNPSKLLRVGHSIIGITGWMVSLQILERVFAKAGEPPALACTAEIFDVFQWLHARLKEEYFLVPRGDAGDSYESSQMNVLIANPYGIFSVASHRSVVEFERFWASGSGMEYALGAMQMMYEATTTDAKLVAEAGVWTASDFDNGTGLPCESHMMPLYSSLAAEDERQLLSKV